MAKYEVAVMHDYYVDRLVHTKDLAALTASVRRKALSGGGGIHDVEQSEVRGGNAVNLASALSALGLRTLLITHSDPEHIPLLRAGFAGTGAELRVKPLPPGLTVAFEERVNVMLGHLGGAGDFPPSMLDGEDWEALESSELVCSVNWAANRSGTELLLSLRRRLGPGKRIFLDPADVRDRLERLPALLEAINKDGAVDWLSVNEFEAAAIAREIGLRAKDHDELCSGLAVSLGVRVDLHTGNASFTATGRETTRCVCKRVAPRRLTGAGDVWDAASIYCDLKGMDDKERLRFANAAGRVFVSSRNHGPPTLSRVRAAL